MFHNSGVGSFPKWHCLFSLIVLMLCHLCYSFCWRIRICALFVSEDIASCVLVPYALRGEVNTFDTNPSLIDLIALRSYTDTHMHQIGKRVRLLAAHTWSSSTVLDTFAGMFAADYCTHYIAALLPVWAHWRSGPWSRTVIHAVEQQVTLCYLTTAHLPNRSRLLSSYHYMTRLERTHAHNYRTTCALRSLAFVLQRTGNHTDSSIEQSAPLVLLYRTLA